MSDQNQFSPNNIHILSSRKVTRINRIITKLITLIFKHILSTTFSKKCMEARQENLYVDLGAERVKVLQRHPSHTITPFGWSNSLSYLISVPFFQSSYRKNQFSSFCTQNFLFKECWRISPTGETTFNLTFPIFFSEKIEPSECLRTPGISLMNQATHGEKYTVDYPKHKKPQAPIW